MVDIEEILEKEKRLYNAITLRSGGLFLVRTGGAWLTDDPAEPKSPGTGLSEPRTSMTVGGKRASCAATSSGCSSSDWQRFMYPEGAQGRRVGGGSNGAGHHETRDR